MTWAGPWHVSERGTFLEFDAVIRWATHILLLGALVLLGACARPELTDFSEPHPDATVERIFMATQRTPGQQGQIFGERRSTRLNFAQVDVSIPPTHVPGKVERTSGVADAAQYFAPLGIEMFSGIRDFTGALRREGGADGGILLYVHGYNNTTEDSTFRLAQIKHDFGIDGPAVLFSWPSAGDPRGYVYDRDSVLFARDGFEEFLRELRGLGHSRILILAHSMGGYLTMEALRQIALKGDRHVMDAIEGVVLMSPDIDPDVFRRQARVIGELPQPFIVMTSRKDRVLNIAEFMTGRKPRLGRIESSEEVQGLGVTVVDFTDLDDGGISGHSAAVSSARAIEVFSGLEQQIREDGGALRDFVLQGRDRRIDAALVLQ